MASQQGEMFHFMHLRGGFEVHADCPVCYETHNRPVTVADLEIWMERLVARMTAVFDDGLGSVRDALTEDETAQATVDARIETLLEELAAAAQSPTPADPGAVADLVARIKRLTAHDTADATQDAPAPAEPANGTEASA
jgi:hypothetical protein